MDTTSEAVSLKTLPGTARATLLTPAQVAARWQIPEKTLSVWRSTNRVRLPYVKVGGAVRYRVADVDKFEADNTHVVEV